jgi:hypothetical protein
MAKEFGSDKSPEPLKIQLARSRERLGMDLKGLRYELDFPRKIRRSFQDRTVVWIAAAVAVGTIVVLLPRPRKKVYVGAKSAEKSKGKLVEAGFLLGALRIAATLLRPVIADFIKHKMTSRGGGRWTSSKW